jgi:S-adenosylmethionine synthetase
MSTSSIASVRRALLRLSVFTVETTGLVRLTWIKRPHDDAAQDQPNELLLSDTGSHSFMSSTANIVVCVRRAVLHSDAGTEMCEHKGVGHPDTLCDNAVEAAARALSRAYLDDYGAIQHFNLDKALLIGGLSAPKFRGGRLLRPMRLIVSGPVAELASQSALAIIQEAIYAHLKATLDVDSSMIAVEPAVRASAPSLRRVNGPAAMPLANDTSFGVGYAPLSRLE